MVQNNNSRLSISLLPVSYLANKFVFAYKIVLSVSLGDANRQVGASLSHLLTVTINPIGVAVELDANAPSSDPDFNSLEINSALEPDLETFPGILEPSPPLELERIEEAAAEKLEALVVEVEASEQKKILCTKLD